MEGLEEKYISYLPPRDRCLLKCLIVFIIKNDAATFIWMTFSIMTLSNMTLSIILKSLTLIVMTISITIKRQHLIWHFCWFHNSVYYSMVLLWCESWYLQFDYYWLISLKLVLTRNERGEEFFIYLLCDRCLLKSLFIFIT
jgi:hypothetical protein